MTTSDKGSIQVPARTSWPMVLALGLMLVLTGLVTHYSVAIAGGVVFLAAAAGWWRQVFPHERHETAPIQAPLELESKPMARAVAHLRVGRMGHRVRVPTHIQPYSAGIKGGLAGAVAMGVVAIVFGLIEQSSIWYPINLFAAAVVPSLANASVMELAAFSVAGLIVGAVVHLLTSSLVGLLYAVTLPMFPRRAWLWAGLVAPLLWSGLIASVLDVVNPTLNSEDRLALVHRVAICVRAGLRLRGRSCGEYRDDADVAVGDAERHRVLGHYGRRF